MGKIRSFLSKKGVVSVVIIIIVLTAIATSLFFYDKYKIAKNPAATARDEVASLTAKVGKLIELPNETPTLATVADKSKLADQPFFEKAQNGDKVLIFTNAAKAILYRPSVNKIIEVAPLSLTNTNPNATPTSEVEISYKIAIYNGTKIAGYAKTTAEALASQFKNIEVIETANAFNDYEKSVVVDLKGSQSTLAEELAKAIKGTVGKYPEGERENASADFLIILGE